MFWGLILKANKKYTQVLEKPFHLTKASLDYANADSEPVQVMYSDGKSTFLLCTLQKDKDLQCSLDLAFNEGDTLCFSTKGNGIVHLTGYLIPEEDMNFDPEMDEEDSDISDEEEEETEVADLREKLSKKQKDKKKDKKVAAKAESSDDDDEELPNGNNLDSSAAADSDDSDDDEAEDDSDDESLDEEEESDEEDESEEEVEMPTKKAKLDPEAAKKQQKNGLENGQQKKKDQKDKNGQKEQQQQKNKPQQADNSMKKLQGGLQYQDLKVGNGAEAKPGKKIQVYYEGKLQKSGKTFDSTKSGPGFKMTLGRGEVIKGWDFGLAGMKAGGKRRLVIPPHLGYGAKGNPPVIPPNSTLIFDVELKNVM